MTRLDSCSVTGGACGSDVPAIEVRGLSFTYPGAEAPVLDGLDWSVPQGAFALLVGGTGSGKSTLLSLLKPEISLASCACWVRASPVWTSGRLRSAWAMCFRTPRTRSFAKACGTRWRLVWKTWACRATRYAAAWPRPAISLGWRTGSTAIPIRFRVAASSCCRLLPSWRCVRACCCSTSPRPNLIPLPRRIFCMRCFA